MTQGDCFRLKQVRNEMTLRGRAGNTSNNAAWIASSSYRLVKLIMLSNNQ